MCELGGEGGKDVTDSEYTFIDLGSFLADIDATGGASGAVGVVREEVGHAFGAISVLFGAEGYWDLVSGVVGMGADMAGYLE